MCPPESFAKNLSADSIEPNSFIPTTNLGQKAFQLASSLLHPSILNHSIRTYLWARAIAASRNSIYYTDPANRDLLFTACILHDIGTTETYNTGPARFEVEGADAAVALLSEFGMDEKDKKEVWMAIALHTSNGIVKRMGELCELVRLAIEIDFGVGKATEGIENMGALRRPIEEKFERMEIEKVLGDAVVAQAVKNPEKAPKHSWPGELYRSHLENPWWKGVNKEF